MIASMLCAIGIIIPMFSPIKIVIEPASFTLASHVAIMIAMFMSPSITATVCIGTTIGFLLGGFPITIIMRAATHIIFALTGSFLIQKKPTLLSNTKQFIPFIFLLSILHAVCEVFVVIPFFFSGVDTSNFFYAIIILVGVGTIIHSMIDFMIAKLVYTAIKPAK